MRAVAASVLIALTTPAQAAWTVRASGAGSEAFVNDSAKTAALALSCRSGAPLSLKIVAPSRSGASRKGSVQVKIDGAEFPFRVEGGEDSLILSDAPGPGLGLSAATVEAIRAGKRLSVAGAGFASGLGFELSGAQSALKRLESLCGGRRASAPPAATLPLASGVYAAGGCANASDVLRTIGVYMLADGPDAGRQFLSPVAEGVSGNCHLKSVSANGDIYSGSPGCQDDGRIAADIGTYRFRYKIIDSKNFASRGKTYTWCAPHR